MTVSISFLEAELNHLQCSRRLAALDELLQQVNQGLITFPKPSILANLHCHTTYSFNAYGYSPAYLAWKARLTGLAAAGTIDFDVLDAVDEFLESARKVGLRACAGIETRVFVKAFATREINSPGEPGISYHMGLGFTTSQPSGSELVAEFKATAQERNRSMLNRVNPHLAPVTLDYEKDVVSLTPDGNATERHLCVAFDVKAREVFPDTARRAAFWAEKLGSAPEKITAILDDAPALQGLIRSKMMKAGGPGYAKPSGPDFPTLESVNAFVCEAGAIPTFAWLDGTTAGEQAIEELLDVMQADGVAAVNIIPDRNWNIKDPEQKKVKVAKLDAFIALAQSRHLPIVVGTEMNAYGNKFVDDFDAPELKPYVPVFMEGAYIMYAHTRLQAQAGMGYLSDWAKKHFDTVSKKNAFYKQVGEKLAPETVLLRTIDASMMPDSLLQAL